MARAAGQQQLLASPGGPRMHSRAHTHPKMSCSKARLSLPTLVAPCAVLLAAAATGVSVGVGVSEHSPAPFPAHPTPPARRSFPGTARHNPLRVRMVAGSVPGAPQSGLMDPLKELGVQNHCVAQLWK